MHLKINRVEFIITNQCTGQCKHCSEGDKLGRRGHLEYEMLKGLLTQLGRRFTITSVMCFGGEPLLYYKEAKGILAEASECNIAKRQMITNGFFTKDNGKIRTVAQALEEAGVNDILLSVDAFHQETIPLEPVYEFAKRIREGNRIRLRLHPAWVVNQEHDNPYNRKTRELLSRFEPLDLPVSRGNNIFPAGKAVDYLAEYFPAPEADPDFRCGDSPYSTRLDEVESISISPNGDVHVCCFPIGNVYTEDINEILDRYQPYGHPMMRRLLEDGVSGLIEYAGEQNVVIDPGKHHSACGICREIVDKLCENQSRCE